MSSINGVGSNLPFNSINGVAASHKATTGTTVSTRASDRTSDRVELSNAGGVSQYLSALKSNDVRTDKVASVRAAIEKGNYDDDYKLDVAVDRLLEDLNA